MKPKYSLLLDEDGGIIDDLMATRRGEDFYVVVNGATKHGDIAIMRGRLPGDVVVDYMKEQALLALQGPRAAEVLETIVPGVGELGFMQAGPFRVARPQSVDQPLGLYRRGRVRDFGARNRRRRARRRHCRARACEADRPRRARFAAARGGAPALRPRSRSEGPRR